MDCNHINIVCYTGGTCGDLISALLDTQGAVLNADTGTVMMPDYRIRLKKPHLFDTVESKNQYLQSVPSDTCVSSHDLNYHVQQHHNFISITVQDEQIALWAARRFRQLHRPHVWQEMQQRCGATTVEQYAQTLIDYSSMVANLTDKIVTLESIVAGHAAKIENSVGIKLSNNAKTFYQNWLRSQQL